MTSYMDKCGVLAAQDGLLQRLQARGWVDAERLFERLLNIAIGLQRAGRVAREVERPHELLPGAFAQRVVDSQGAYLAEQAAGFPHA